MRLIPRRLLISLLLLWIVLLSASASLLRFNKYEGSATPIVDCDTDSELVFVLFAALIWVSSILLCIWVWRANPRFPRWLALVAIAIALLASGNAAFRTSQLISHNVLVKAFCATIIPMINKIPVVQRNFHEMSKQTPRRQ